MSSSRRETLRSATYLRCRLPIELMYLIFDALANCPSGLSKLVALHPRFKLHIERMLYQRRIYFKDRRAHIGFLDTMTKSKRLAANVLHYELRSPAELGGWQAEDIDKVAPAVANMVNLKLFRVDMWQHNPFDPDELFQALKDKQLIVFEWEAWCRKQEITDLLRTQPHITHLKTQYMTMPEKPLQRECCRGLWYLSGDRAVMNSIMPYRNIEVLVWTPLMPEGNVPLHPLVATAVDRLRALSYDGKRARHLPIHLINGLGRRLEVLQVTVENAAQPVFLEAVERMISLKTLIIMCSHEGQEAYIRQPQLLARIAQPCPTLQSIYIAKAIPPAKAISPWHPYQHWRITRCLAPEQPDPPVEPPVTIVECVTLQGTEYGDRFHILVDKMRREKYLKA